MRARSKQVGETILGKPSRSRRILSLVSGRDWAGIVIELAIVTLGVLLAFRVDQWGQDRRQAQQERQFLSRMWKETADIASESRESARAHRAEVAGLRAAFESRNDPAKLMTLNNQIGGAGCRMFVLPSQGVSDANAQELLNSGQLDIVSDPGLRDQLRELAATQAEAAGQLAYARQVVPMIDDHVGPYMTATLDAAGRNQCRLNWSAALADPRAVTSILRARRVHELMGDERAAVSELAGAAHNALACALGKGDCRKP